MVGRHGQQAQAVGEIIEGVGEGEEFVLGGAGPVRAWAQEQKRQQWHDFHRAYDYAKTAAVSSRRANHQDSNPAHGPAVTVLQSIPQDALQLHSLWSKALAARPRLGLRQCSGALLP